MQQWIAMGYIKGAFGIKGWVKIHADTEYTDGLLDYPQWRLVKDGRIVEVEVAEAKAAGDELQVRFTHIGDRDAAALLRGYTVEVPRSAFAETEADEFYWADLVGMRVINRNGEELGKVSGLMETGAHDVLVVQDGEGKRLIPFVAHFIDQVDAPNRTITADWGLDY